MTDKSWADVFHAYSVLSLIEVGRSNADPQSPVRQKRKALTNQITVLSF